MTKEQLRDILGRVLTWPPERQADVARTIKLQDRSELHLADDQHAEVGRRRAKQSLSYIALAEARRRFGL
jgi:hypothetical protein